MASLRTSVHDPRIRASIAEKALRRPFLFRLAEVFAGPEAPSVRLSRALLAAAEGFRRELEGAPASRRLTGLIREAEPLVPAARRPGRPLLEFRLAQALRDALFLAGEFRREAAAYEAAPGAPVRELAGLACELAARLHGAAACAARDRRGARSLLEEARALRR